jgi:hypothetical protein
VNLRKIIDQYLETFKAFESYRCVMELNSWKNGKETIKLIYVYRAPGDVRIEQVGGFHNGAVLVMRSNGKIRARGGGVLSIFKIDLRRNSKLLIGITGDSAVESDWGSIFLKFKQMLPYVIKTDFKAIRIDSRAGYEFKAYLKNQPFDRAHIVIRKDGPICQLERFRNKKRMNQIIWRNVELNVNVADTAFDL